MTSAYLNDVATAVPGNEVHGTFIRFARRLLAADPRRQLLFDRMAKRAAIERRYSSLSPAADRDGPCLDDGDFYRLGGFPSTGARTRRYQAAAPALAAEAVERLAGRRPLGTVTHLIVTTCTGLSAPGLDLELIERCRLPRSVARTVIGFMGCHAALIGLRTARQIVRAEPAARVLMVNLELCTLHLQETDDLEQMLCFLLFGDGCAASLVTAESDGLMLEEFRTEVVPTSAEHITWTIGDQGFDMVLTGAVPGLIAETLEAAGQDVLGTTTVSDIRHWAVHPGGRSVLDAVERGLALGPARLDQSRSVLRDYGNMSSPSIMFVLAAIMAGRPAPGLGCALAFGPGLTIEAMKFRVGI